MPLAGTARLRRRWAQARQFLARGHHVAFVHQHVGDLGTFLVDADDRLPARHDKAGGADQIGETGIGGLGHNNGGLDRQIRLLRMRPMLKQVISDAERPDTDHR